MSQYEPLHPEVRSQIGPPTAVRVLGALVGTFGMALVTGNLLVDPDGMTIVGGVIAVAAGVSTVAARLTLDLAADRLRIRFLPFLSVTLTRHQVRSASPCRVEALQLGGIGIRRLGDARVLTMSGGSAVLLETAKGRFLVQVQDAAAVTRSVEAWISGSSDGASS